LIHCIGCSPFEPTFSRVGLTIRIATVKTCRLHNLQRTCRYLTRFSFAQNKTLLAPEECQQQLLQMYKRKTLDQRRERPHQPLRNHIVKRIQGQTEENQRNCRSEPGGGKAQSPVGPQHGASLLNCSRLSLYLPWMAGSFAAQGGTNLQFGLCLELPFSAVSQECRSTIRNLPTIHNPGENSKASEFFLPSIQFQYDFSDVPLLAKRALCSGNVTQRIGLCDERYNFFPFDPLDKILKHWRLQNNASQRS
jgi:hypothetical protein